MSRRHIHQFPGQTLSGCQHGEDKGRGQTRTNCRLRNARFFLTTLLLAPLAAMVIGLASVSAAEKTNTDPKQQLARPDTKAPDTKRPAKVFILMGQSNMVGMGDLGPETTTGTLADLTKKKGKYPWLIDDGGNWTVRKDVYYYDARVKKGSPLSPTSNNGKTIGPELGFGYVMGHVLDEPVLVLKSCIGNRSLGWDLLPPGSQRYEAEVTERGQKVLKVFAGYKDSPDSWVKGTEPKPIAWYAGKQYDDDMANAKAALENLAKIYPDYKGQGYEIAGFVWWQGQKDTGSAAHASRYEQNLVRLIRCLRKDYNAPNAKFVLATGCGNPGREGLGLQIAEAQIAVSGERGKYPEFKDNVKAIDSRDFWREANVSPKNQGYHYNRNAETYMEVGLGLGWAMADLLKNKPWTWTRP